MIFPLRTGAVLAAALLAACATTPSFMPAPSFELAGRIAVRYQERAFTGSLRWTQNAQGDDIWLSAPLGQTVARVQADAQGATLTAADQKQYRASSVESLTESGLGWRFPLAGMRHWVLGQPAPNLPLAGIERDGANRLTRCAQGEWQVAFEYAAPGAPHPSRVEVAGTGATIRLVVDSLTLQ
jgi:outer membrane lipoprotein LolB